MGDSRFCYAQSPTTMAFEENSRRHRFLIYERHTPVHPIPGKCTKIIKKTEKGYNQTRGTKGLAYIMKFHLIELMEQIIYLSSWVVKITNCILVLREFPNGKHNHIRKWPLALLIWIVGFSEREIFRFKLIKSCLQNFYFVLRICKKKFFFSCWWSEEGTGCVLEVSFIGEWAGKWKLTSKLKIWASLNRFPCLRGRGFSAFWINLVFS